MSADSPIISGGAGDGDSDFAPSWSALLESALESGDPMRLGRASSIMLIEAHGFQSKEGEEKWVSAVGAFLEDPRLHRSEQSASIIAALEVVWKVLSGTSRAVLLHRMETSFSKFLSDHTRFAISELLGNEAWEDRGVVSILERLGRNPKYVPLVIHALEDMHQRSPQGVLDGEARNLLAQLRLATSG